ncbi:hypothetical protein GGI43DRAFT_396591 [Trichoderma evansii]
MKFLATLLFAAAGVSAASTAEPTAAPTAAPAASSPTSPDAPGSTCLAEYILRDCLHSTTKTADACDPTDYTCLCAAYQAVLTCYNNCPNDISAPAVKNQADSYCRVASQFATTTAAAPKTKTSDSSDSEETSSEASGDDEATPTGESGSTPTSGEGDETSATSSSATTAARTSSSKAAAAPTMIGNVAGIVMAVAGAAAVAIL